MTAPESVDPTLRATAELLLEGVGDVRVLVVGDCMLDRYVTGDVDRVSPEAPVPVVRVRDERRALGGAGNVAAGVAALGATCRLVALVGPDDAGEATRSLLERAGIGADDLLSVPERPTTVKSRILARHQQILRVDREVDGPLPPALRDAIVDRGRDALAWADVVLAVDYDKGALSAGVGRDLLAAAGEADVPSVVDPKLRDFFEYRGAFVFKPNAGELAAALGAEAAPRTGEELEAVRSRLACRHLLMTRGEEGMVLVTEDRPGVETIASRAREVYDVTGAGDTVTAVLGVAVAAGVDLPEAASLANFAAGLQVSRLGAVPIRLREVLDALDGGSGAPEDERERGGPYVARAGTEIGDGTREEER